nr:hypothetical protein CFP56_34102 [Quercus suber]
MENHIEAKEYGWTDSGDSDFSVDLFPEEHELDLLSSEDSETPFARHGPTVDPNLEEIAIQRNFWNLYAIGFILDYRKFSMMDQEPGLGVDMKGFISCVPNVVLLVTPMDGQCTHCMEDIEIMLYSQRLRIQDLHQVQYRFDALQPQFTNDLRAFHNRRRRWTTQIRYGLFNHPTNHAAPTHPNTAYLDPSTPSTPHSPYAETLTFNL